MDHHSFVQVTMKATHDGQALPGAIFTWSRVGAGRPRHKATSRGSCSTPGPFTPQREGAPFVSRVLPDGIESPFRLAASDK